MSLPWRGALRYGTEMGQFLGLDIVFIKLQMRIEFGMMMSVLTWLSDDVC
jgi:hypothetical protein